MRRPSLVAITEPDGLTYTVMCRDQREVLCVVLEESKRAEPMTIMTVKDLVKDKMIDRWAISKDGELVHSPYCR